MLVLGTGPHGIWYWGLWYRVLVGVRVVPSTFLTTNFLLKNKGNFHPLFTILFKTKSAKRERKDEIKVTPSVAVL